jgi:hypothetical protein
MSIRDAAKAVRTALRKHFEQIDKGAMVKVDIAPSEMIHITVVSDSFHKMPQRRRLEALLATLDGVTLADQSVTRRISRCMLFTPEEYEETYGRACRAA